MKHKWATLVTMQPEIYCQNSQSLYPTEPFKKIHITMRHPVLLFQNRKSKIHKVSSLLSKPCPFFCFVCSVEVDPFNKCMETSRILDFPCKDSTNQERSNHFGLTNLKSMSLAFPTRGNRQYKIIQIFEMLHYLHLFQWNFIQIFCNISSKRKC